MKVKLSIEGIKHVNDVSEVVIDTINAKIKDRSLFRPKHKHVFNWFVPFRRTLHVSDLLCILLLLADFLESVVDQVAHQEELQEVVKEDVVDIKHKLVTLMMLEYF